MMFVNKCSESKNNNKALIKRSIFAAVTVLIAALALVLTCACSQKNTIQVADANGQMQTVEQPITRVCSSHNPTMNDIVALGGGGKYVVGFSYKELASGLYERVIDNWAEIPSVWDGKNINVEAVKKMNAQLCFIPEIQTKVIPSFEEAGVPCFIALPEEESFQTVKESLGRIAKILNEEERCTQITDKCGSIIDGAKALASKAQTQPKVIFMASSKYKVYTKKALQDSIIKTAGGVNPASELEQEKQSKSLSAEELAALNPDVIWVPNYADFKVADILNDPALANTPAVKNGKVYEFPCALEPWDFPDAACCLGVSWATYNLHPDLYTKEQVIKNANELYTLLYNKAFTAQEMGL